MRIAPHSIGVGKFMVVGIKVENEESHVSRYFNHYELALNDAQESWYKNRDKGYIYIVVEVQCVVQSQGVPNLATKLTEKL